MFSLLLSPDSCCVHFVYLWYFTFSLRFPKFTSCIFFTCYFLFQISIVYKLCIFELLFSRTGQHCAWVVYLWLITFSYRFTLCISCISLTCCFLFQTLIVYGSYFFDMLISFSDSHCKICIFLPSYFLLQITIVYESYIFDLLLTLSDSKSLKNCISLTWYFLFQILIVYRLYIIDWMLSFSDSLCV